MSEPPRSRHLQTLLDAALRRLDEYDEEIMRLRADFAHVVIANADVAKLNAEQAETIERLTAALTDIRDLPLMTLTIARSRATYALREADEPSGVCALSVSPSALQGTNSADISTLDGTQDALRMRCSNQLSYPGK